MEKIYLKKKKGKKSFQIFNSYEFTSFSNFWLDP